MSFDLLQFLTGKSDADDGGVKTLVVKSQRCPQSHKCPAVRVCPSGALTQKGFAAPVVNYSKCTSCGKCSHYCAFKALSMEKK
ncbi:4Fe-4S binding protein [uncultured Sphaerochaeta sp.]|uniref:ATP-binding protein n=1 Tax=uncultured Sphaerochaeta sp. TaxID=886478 RepID=UPI002A0A5BA4|nr:4Fe-4S binding protein [uncultured Sphaerochaeta sp.]